MVEFTPKGEETLRTEVLEDLGLTEYEGNEEVVDRVVARRKTDEDFKVSVHSQKKEHQTTAEQRAEFLKKAGFDPKTGEKLTTNVVEQSKNEGLTAKDVIAIRDLHEEDLDLVLAEAKLRGLSVAETKNLPFVRSALKDLAETRKTAEATSVVTNRRSSSKSNEDLTKKIYGDIPDDQLPEAANAVLKTMFK